MALPSALRSTWIVRTSSRITGLVISCGAHKNIPEVSEGQRDTVKVESLSDGQWHILSNATANNVESNRYFVTITEVPLWVRLTALDGAPLRVDGRQAFRV